MDILLFGSFLSFFEKIDFLFKKYVLLLKHFFVPHKISQSKTSIFKTPFYYESKLGLVLMQVSLAHHSKMLKNLNLKKDSVMIDIGANIGCFSILYKKIYPEARVFCIEPIPKIFDCLSKNISFLEGVRAENIAIMDRNGKYRFVFNENNPEMSRMDKSGSIVSRALTLDEFTIKNKIREIDLLKIDVETFEKHILLGGTKTLSKTKYLLLEVSYEEVNRNYSFSELMAHLYTKDFNYQLITILNFLDKDIEKTKIIDMLFRNESFNETKI